MMSNAEIVAILDMEIKWCLEHSDKEVTADYRKGFINGLIQAKYLLCEAKPKPLPGVEA